MGHTYFCLPVHFVFSTKNRLPWITPQLKQRLVAYTGGIIRAEDCSLLEMNSMPDHVHLLVMMHPSKAAADLMRDVKASTSGWIHRTFKDLRRFEWQRGYGGFGVSRSGIDAVRKYIVEQEKHHKRRTFQEEFIALLEKHEIPYDPRYVWD